MYEKPLGRVASGAARPRNTERSVSLRSTLPEVDQIRFSYTL